MPSPDPRDISTTPALNVGAILDPIQTLSHAFKAGSFYSDILRKITIETNKYFTDILFLIFFINK
jgi:hypothetical protein